jgi:cephalosporin hydroxylase
MGKGRVIGVDIEIRPNNRQAIKAHEMAPLITLVDGSSIAPDVVRKVRSLINRNDTVLVILASNHTRDHVFKELEAYHDLVTPGSYIVATEA